MASKPTEELEYNRNWAKDSIKFDRPVEALSCLTDNICYLKFGTRKQESIQDIDSFIEAFSQCAPRNLEKTIKNDIDFARRVHNGVNLELEEVDILYSRVGGVLGLLIAAREAGQNLEVLDIDIEWIREMLSSRSDLESANSRISRNYSLYIDPSILLEEFERSV